MKEKRIVGKQTGCDIVKGGGYRIAPMYAESFGKLRERQAGVDRLVASVTNHCVEINTLIESERVKLWRQIKDDLGLDTNKHYQYNWFNQTITEVKEEKK